MKRPELMLASFVCWSGNVLNRLSRADRERDLLGELVSEVDIEQDLGAEHLVVRRVVGLEEDRAVVVRADERRQALERVAHRRRALLVRHRVLEAILGEPTEEERAELRRVGARTGSRASSGC